ncbi:MAG: amidohydrolase, partial [Segetibacter sp.]
MSIVKKDYSRRQFISETSVLIIGATLNLEGAAFGDIKNEPIIDIHQHIHYHERTDEQLLNHQRTLGITKTILLPSGRPVNSSSTHNGISNGLQAETGGNAE